MTKHIIALYGGAFDPVHNGHINIAKYLTENNITDEVWFLPSLISPQKDYMSMAPFADRVKMLNLAINGLKSTKVSEFEEEFHYESPTSDKTYTSEILDAIHQRYSDFSFKFVVGFDSIKNISTWHNYKYLIENYSFIIFDRNDEKYSSLDDRHKFIENFCSATNIDINYKYVDAPITDISSTYIKELLKKREINKLELSKYLDANVLKYIEVNRLYGV